MDIARILVKRGHVKTSGNQFYCYTMVQYPIKHAHSGRGHEQRLKTKVYPNSPDD